MEKNFWNKQDFFSQTYSLIIKTDENILDKINFELGFKNAKLVNKGSVISRVTGEINVNIYSYDKSFDDDVNLKEFSDFLDELIVRSEIINKYINQCEVSLRIFLQCSQAQLYFKFPPEIIQKIHKLSIPLEMSILSWGEIN